MTGQELQLLRQSSNLCNQRQQILSQLNSLKAQQANMAKNIKPDPVKAAKKAGEEAVKNRHIQIIHWVWAMLATLIPIILCGVYYKVAELDNEYFMLIGEGIGFVLFFVTLFYVRKRDLVKVRKKAEAAYIENHRRINQHYQSQRDALHLQIYELSQKYYQLNRKMQDPAQCCIPQSQWHNGPQLYRLVSSGKANSLEEAIQIQYQIDAQEAAYQQKLAAEETARWKKMEDMMRQQEEDITRDKANFLDDMQKMALVGMLLSDD